MMVWIAFILLVVLILLGGGLIELKTVLENGLSTEEEKAKAAAKDKKKNKYAKGYQIAVYKTKRNAKNKKNAVLKKYAKKATMTIKSSKIKGMKKLYIRVRAYNIDGKDKMFGSWSKVKSVEIK